MERFWPWLIALAFSIAFPLGLALTGVLSFWAGVIIVTSACLVPAAYPWFAWKQKAHKFLATSGVAAAYLIALWLVFVPAPLVTLINTPFGNYVEGDVVNGIKWTDDFSPVDVAFRNDTNIDYTNFEVHIRTNHWIDRVGINKGNSQCVSEAEIPGIDISGAEISGTNKEGKRFSFPLFRSDQPVFAHFFHIQCDKLAANSKIEVVLAVIGAAPTDPLAWAALAAGYTAANRQRKRFVSRCFLSSCGNMPKSSWELFGGRSWN